jgi:hypothetical protein
MMLRMRFAFLAGLGMALGTLSARGADIPASLTKGTPDLKSAGPLAFGPEGMLFVGDTKGAAIFAIDTGERDKQPTGGNVLNIEIEGIDVKIAALLGTSPQQILINDLAVNPLTGNAYLSVARGRGPDAIPTIVRVSRATMKPSLFSLEGVRFAKAERPNPPAPGETPKGQSPRAESITDLAYFEGRVFVAGLSNEQFSSRFLAIPFPFSGSPEGASIEIYHGSHGQFETKSPLRTFATSMICGCLR